FCDGDRWLYPTARQSARLRQRTAKRKPVPPGSGACASDQSWPFQRRASVVAPSSPTAQQLGFFRQLIPTHSLFTRRPLCTGTSDGRLPVQCSASFLVRTLARVSWVPAAQQLAFDTQVTALSTLV